MNSFKFSKLASLVFVVTMMVAVSAAAQSHVPALVKAAAQAAGFPEGGTMFVYDETGGAAEHFNAINKVFTAGGGSIPVVAPKLSHMIYVNGLDKAVKQDVAAYEVDPESQQAKAAVVRMAAWLAFAGQWANNPTATDSKAFMAQWLILDAADPQWMSSEERIALMAEAGYRFVLAKRLESTTSAKGQLATR